MSRILKMSGGALLLLLFLFPQAQKGWHDFEHRHDTHCYATAEIHLHQLEHVCEICDISIAVGIKSSFIIYDIVLNSIQLSFSDGLVKTYPANFWRLLPPRAPPVFVS
jgi:hypothetical protein